MATVTGYTAAKMQEFADASVVSGTVVGSNLHLTTAGGTVIDAGSVVGPAGQNAQAVMSILDTDTVDLTLTGTGTVADPWVIKADSKTRGSASQRDSYFGVPATLADKVALANKNIIWYNTDKKWFESYFAVTGSAGLTVVGLLSGFPEGWYPIQDGAVFAHRGIDNGFQSMDGTLREPVMSASKTLRGGIIDVVGTNNSVQVPLGGLYRLSTRLYATGGTPPTNFFSAQTQINGTNIMETTGTKPDSSDQRVHGSTEYPLHASDIVKIVIYAGAVTNTWGTSGYNGTAHSVEYVGPPLANF